MTETPTPHLDTVYALTKLLEKSLARSRGAVIEQCTLTRLPA